MKKLLFISILLSSYFSFAQDEEKALKEERVTSFKVGLIGGASYSGGDQDAYYHVDTEYIWGVDAGMTFEYDFSKFVGIEMDLMWLSRGYLIPMIFTDNNGNVTGEGTERIELGYMSMPILIKGMTGSRITFNGFLGIAPGVRFKAKREIESNNGVEYNYVSEVSSQIKMFDLSAVGGFGVDFPIRKYLIGWNCRYFYGVTDIFTSFTHKEGNRAVSCSLSLVRKF